MASYEKMTNQEFEKYIPGFENVKDLHYVFLNVLNPMLSRGCFYCFFEEFQGPNTEFNGPRQCSLCHIPTIFNDFKKKKKKDYNQNNLLFLKIYYSKLLSYLMEIFIVKKTAVECFLDNDFEYSGNDWYAGQ